MARANRFVIYVLLVWRSTIQGRHDALVAQSASIHQKRQRLAHRAALVIISPTKANRDVFYVLLVGIHQKRQRLAHRAAWVIISPTKANRHVL